MAARRTARINDAIVEKASTPTQVTLTRCKAEARVLTVDYVAQPGRRRFSSVISAKAY
jgi:hypothetical protein